jgi:alpha-D-ribose 1-methylphosphonate 5-triphosphate synthase subunit PhnL
MVEVQDLSKTFVLHTQGGARLPVFANLALAVAPGECVALHGPSGVGKSTLLRSLYANYRPTGGRVLVRHGDRVVDMVSASPREVLDVRRSTIGYVSQMLRVIPRVPALEIVAESLTRIGTDREEARSRAATLLARLNIPERLWGIAPATFSGGEQQRVNVARTFVVDYPVLLLDEPTSALDAANRAIVVELIGEAKARGAAILGIFHDHEVRDAVADRLYDLAPDRTAA